MRSTIAVSAAIAAAGLASADQGCSGASSLLGGNYYCSAVKQIKYQNFGSTGSFNKVTSMSNGACASEPQSYSGSLAPLDGEVSMHFRGPLELKQFAFYQPGSGSSSKTKRTPTERRHAHARAHANHAHAHAHKREAEPAVGDMVTATIDGQVVSWANTYTGATTDPAVPAAPAVNKVAAAAVGAAGGSVGGAASGQASAAGASSGSASGSAAGSAASSYQPEATGDWVRAGYYDASSQTAEGVTFLGNYGGMGSSGTFDYQFGNSLSYVDSTGCAGSTSPQVLADTRLPSNKEITILSDKQCSGNSCGFVRPGSTAYHGFGGSNKVFLFEFSMPSDGSKGFNADMPSIWMLNADIPRTMQYAKPSSCSCWESGCGEFDLFEVLDSGSDRCKSTLHGNVAGGASDYFDRPTSGTVKAAVVMSDEEATITMLADDFDFSTGLSNEDVQAMCGSSSKGNANPLGALGGLVSKIVGDAMDSASTFVLG